MPSSLSLLAKLKEQLNDLQQQKENTDQNIQECLDIINGMHDEFEHIPNMNTLNELLEKLFSLNVRLQELQEKKRALEKNTLAAFDAYKSAERKMLSVCSLLPYRREEDSYDEVLNDMEEYRECLHSLSLACKQIESFQSQVHVQTETREQFLEEVDQLIFEESELKNSISSLQMQIKKIEEVLQNPETIEKAQKLKEIHLKQEQNQKALIDRNRQIGILQHDLQESDMRLAELKNQVSETEACLKKVQQYFEEEISLNILFDREDKTLDECAKLAIHNEEKQYMVKSSSEMVNSLSEAYQKNNSDISNYNPRFEVLFQSDEFTGSYERTRYIMTFVYGGQKLSLYAFLKELKLAIETQEELISQKDRELFEDILSQTISDKLTQRIQDSRNWVKEMSYLMKKMDTSMGLTFSLDWKPVDPETIDEMDIRELEKILIRDKELITAEDEERVAKHFKSIIRKEKEKERQRIKREIDPQWKHYKLKKYFSECTASSVTLTFLQVEEIDGRPLPSSAWKGKNWWYPRNNCNTIAEAWITEGYSLHAFDLEKKKLTWHRDEEGLSKLEVPKVLTQGKIPDNAKYELETHMQYVISKYGLMKEK